MKLQSVSIRDIKAIHSLDFEAGALTLVEGKNGKGKTSILDAVRCVFEGGHDSSMIRHGAKKGTVTLTVDNGTTIRRTITQNSSTLDIVTSDGAQVKSPQAFVDRLAASFAFDPLAFIHASKKDRFKYLSKVMPVVFTQAEVAEATAELNLKIERDYDLDGLEAIRKGQYEARTAANTANRDLEGMLKTFASSHDVNDTEDWSQKVSELEAKRQESLVELGFSLDEVTTSARAARTNKEKAFQDREREARERLQSELDAISKERLSYNQSVAVAEREAMDEIKRNAQPQLDELTGQIAAAKEKQTAQEKAKTIKEEYDKYRSLVTVKRQAINAITRVLERIDALKQQKLASLPIENLETREGEVFYNGVPFDQLNTQTKYNLAIQIGAQGLGQLPIMICDQAEVYDSDNFAEFAGAIKESGIQVIAAKVADTELAVSAA